MLPTCHLKGAARPLHAAHVDVRGLQPAIHLSGVRGVRSYCQQRTSSSYVLIGEKSAKAIANVKKDLARCLHVSRDSELPEVISFS